jgi:hypothetical protein
MAVAAEMIVGSGLALAQGEGGPEYKGGGNRPPAAPATPAQGAPNPLPRSSPTDAALSNNHYLSHGPQVNTSMARRWPEAARRQAGGRTQRHSNPPRLDLGGCCNVRRARAARSTAADWALDEADWHCPSSDRAHFARGQESEPQPGTARGEAQGMAGLEAGTKSFRRCATPVARLREVDRVSAPGEGEGAPARQANRPPPAPRPCHAESLSSPAPSQSPPESP